jgi:hypothetical protein
VKDFRKIFQQKKENQKKDLKDFSKIFQQKKEK